MEIKHLSYNPSECRKINQDEMLTAATENNFTVCVDLSSRPDYIGISSEEYMRLKKCEGELWNCKEALKQANKITEICRHRPCVFDLSEYTYRYHKNVWEWVLDWRSKCPQICPKWRGGGKDV